MVISWFYFQDIENSSSSVKSCYTQRLNKYTMIREFLLLSLQKDNQQEKNLLSGQTLFIFEYKTIKKKE